MSLEKTRALGMVRGKTVGARLTAPLVLFVLVVPPPTPQVHHPRWTQLGQKGNLSHLPHSPGPQIMVKPTGPAGTKKAQGRTGLHYRMSEKIEKRRRSRRKKKKKTKRCPLPNLRISDRLRVPHLTRHGRDVQVENPTAAQARRA